MHNPLQPLASCSLDLCLGVVWQVREEVRNEVAQGMVVEDKVAGGVGYLGIVVVVGEQSEIQPRPLPPSFSWALQLFYHSISTFLTRLCPTHSSLCHCTMPCMLRFCPLITA